MTRTVNSDPIAGERDDARQQQPGGEEVEDGAEPALQDQAQQSYPHQVLIK